AADIERPDGDLSVRAGVNDLAVALELLLFVGHARMREIEVFGAEQPDAGSPHRAGGMRVLDVVDIRQQLDRYAVPADCRMVAVRRQLVAQQEEFAFQLAVGALGFRIRIDDHVSLAAVENDGVARLDVPNDAWHPANRRNATAAGDDGGVARLAPGLRHNAAHFDA